MTLTAIVGAFLAVIARPRPDKSDPLFTAGYDAGLKDGRREVEDLERDINYLSRELDIQLTMVVHWKEQAQLMARLGREEREAREAQRNATHALQAQAQLQQAYQQLAQHAQQQQAAYNGLPPGAQAQQNAFSFGDFCNCVPSRSQVWHEEQAQQHIVQRLNDNT